MGQERQMRLLNGRIWASSGSWWWTGKPGMLQSMGSQRVGHNWGTELNWYDITLCAVLSRFSHVRLCVTLWTVPRQAPLSMGFSRQEYWNWLPFPSPGNLPHPGIEPACLKSNPLWQAGSLTLVPPGKPNITLYIESRVWYKWTYYETETDSWT